MMVQDTGLGVRKRVIKLLKVFYGATSDLEKHADISTRLVHRMLDEDDTVKVWNEYYHLFSFLRCCLIGLGRQDSGRALVQ